MTIQKSQPKAEPPEKPEPLSEQDAEALLPWYANGRTSHAEAHAIESALKTSSVLRAQLEAVRRERAATIDSTDAAGQPSPENLQRLLKQLGTTRQLPSIHGADRSFLNRMLGSVMAPRPALQFALAAACLVIVLQGVALYRTSSPPEGAAYSTASGQATEATGPYLIVAFKPQATAGAIQALLGEVEASIVKGPTPDGTYIVALPEGANADALLRRLQAHAELIASVAKGG